MALPRVQAFEFNDQEWVPAVLRDTIVESLSRALRWGRVIEGLAGPFEQFLDAAGTLEILDLGSGAGGPASVLADTMRARGRDARFLLTDLFPRPAVWASLRRERPGAIDFVPDPVDATTIPEALSRGRARVILNVLHHLPPRLAAGVVRDAVASGAPLFVGEGFERNPLRFLPFAPAGLCALAASPILARDRRLARAVLAWLTPAAVAASVWDGVVSTLRVYTEAELREMVRAAGGDPSTWRYQRYAFPFGGKGYCFWGGPARRAIAVGRPNLV